MYIYNTCCSFELYVNEIILKKSQFPQKYKAVQLFNIIIRNVS